MNKSESIHINKRNNGYLFSTQCIPRTNASLKISLQYYCIT